MCSGRDMAGTSGRAVDQVEAVVRGRENERNRSWRERHERTCLSSGEVVGGQTPRARRSWCQSVSQAECTDEKKEPLSGTDAGR